MYPAAGLQARGRQIAQEFARQHEALLQGRAVTAEEGRGELYDEIAQVFQKLTLGFPATDNGSKFINSKFILNSRLFVKIDNFQKLYQQQANGNLFMDEVGKTVVIRAIHNDVFGPITTQPQRLIISNMRNKPGAITYPYKVGEQKAPTGRLAAITSEVDMRYKTPGLMTWKVIVDIAFGNFSCRDLELEVQSMGSSCTTSIVIPLPQQEGEISPNGTVTLPNRTTFSMKKVIGQAPVMWVSQTHIEDLDITVQMAAEAMSR